MYCDANNYIGFVMKIVKLASFLYHSHIKVICEGRKVQSACFLLLSNNGNDGKRL